MKKTTILQKKHYSILSAHIFKCLLAVSAFFISCVTAHAQSRITGDTIICVGATTALNDTTSGGTWSSSNTNIATVNTSGVVTGIAAGVGTISYTTTGGTATVTVTVGTSVTFNLSSTYSQCPPLIGNAENTTVPFAGDTLTWQWRITPSGNIVSTSPLSFFYNLAANAVYHITLIATNQLGCKDSLTETATVEGPAGYLSFTPDNGCSPLTATLCFIDTNGTSPTSFTWVTGNGGTYASDTPCITNTFVDTGVYHPYVIITEAGCQVIVPAGNIVAFTDSIQVFPVPTISITPTSPFICYGGATPLTAAGARSYSWSPVTGLSASTGAGIIAAPASTTIYTVTGSNPGCSSTAITTVTADTPISITISGRDSICSGFCDTLIASGGTDNYTWSSATLIASTGDTVIACSAAAQAYKAVYTDLLGCKDSAIFHITINPLPVAGTITGTPTVCPGSNIMLSDTVTIGSWSAVNSNALVSDSGAVLGATAGIDTIKYTVTNSCGTSTASYAITINPLPNAGIITGADSVCVPAPLFLTDTITGGSWSAANSHALVIDSDVVLGVTAGVDTIKYTVTNNCGASTAFKAITVNPLPNAGTIAGIDSVCVVDTLSLTDTITGGSWSATNSHALVSGSGVVLGVTAGIDTIIYSVSNTCGIAIAEKLINITSCNTGVNNISKQAQDITLYPNPTQNNITITSSSTINNVVISNLLGQSLFSQQYDAKAVIISLNQLPSGVYIVKINDYKVYKIIRQ